MLDFLFDYYPFLFFPFSATLKGVVEFYAYRGQSHGGEESSKIISVLFILTGLLTPVLIFSEILFLRHILNIYLSIFFAAGFVILMIVRIICIHELQDHYSVNVRIIPDHKLIKTGIYRYFRHPIYLFSILENIFYPLACSAYISSVILFMIETPAIFIRRRHEEKLLIEKFGEEYLTYRKSTWF